VSRDDELLTETEAARVLKVSPRTLRRWRAVGEGPPWTRLGPRQVRYRRAALLRWLEENEKAPGGLGSEE